ncbi:hypothetical protein [Streptomyces sp. NBC_01294]|uniref:hypothetical protein n=1 Tax=Streptomyces sp. NBC_01294 TaxID=2903815 RepID=UPI002DDB37B7|nr:hypothetical protein [Streptomyces sp. NBC_01294]WRZ56545.1 hypothetical protein OG534_08670 [Streptomyces sp. NBC_01294]
MACTAAQSTSTYRSANVRRERTCVLEVALSNRLPEGTSDLRAAEEPEERRLLLLYRDTA